MIFINHQSVGSFFRNHTLTQTSKQLKLFQLSSNTQKTKDVVFLFLGKTFGPMKKDRKKSFLKKQAVAPDGRSGIGLRIEKSAG